MAECTDAMLCRLLDKMPSCLAYDPRVPLETQIRDRPRWLALQSVVLYTCCTFLRLLIQTLALSSLWSTRRADKGINDNDNDNDNDHNDDDDDELQAVTVCASLAASILEGNNRLSDDGLKYSFPISHYLTSATMVMATLVAKEPALKTKYAATILAATQALHGYCNRTWVSRKMVQWVARLGIFVKRTLADTAEGPAARPHSGRRPAYAQQRQQQQQGSYLTAGPSGSPTLLSDATTQSASRPSSPSRPTNEQGESAAAMAPSGSRQPDSAAPWLAGASSEPIMEMMPDWPALPNVDFGPVMAAGSTDLDPNSDPTGLMSLSANLLGPKRSDGLELGCDPYPYSVFGPLGLTGFFGIDMNGDAGDIDPSLGGMTSPLLGI